MKKIIVFLIFIIVSASLVGIIMKYKNGLDNAYYMLKFRDIEQNLVDLEGAIQFQKGNNWTTPFAATEKIGDVIEGINTTLIVGKDINKIEKDNEETLLLLLKIISKYQKYGDFPDGSAKFGIKDQQDFSKLADDLRKVGWGMEISFGKNDNEFKEAVINLYNYQKEQY